MPVNPPDAAPPSPPLPDRIRAAGRKVTPGRMRVLDLLCRAHQPLSHAQIETLLEAETALRMKVMCISAARHVMVCFAWMPGRHVHLNCPAASG